MTERPDDSLPAPNQRPRIDADAGREPELLDARSGTRRVSRAALVERVRLAYQQEHGWVQPDGWTRTERLKRLRDTADYVLAVESISLTSDARAALLRAVYSNLFGFGPLDPLLADPRITTIALDGPERAAVRYGHADLTPVGPLFDDAAHLREMIGRLLAAAGAELRSDIPVIETGLEVEGRAVAVNVVTPTAAIRLSADLRLHPAIAPTLDTLAENDFMTRDAAHFLAALSASSYGLIVVGDTESGKTTLLSALAQRLPDTAAICAVERAGELRLPPHATRRMVTWPVGEAAGVSFGEQIAAALAERPDVLLLDEVRADDPASIAPLLAGEQGPRQWWTFRGAPDAKRLQAALGMLARRAGNSEDLVHALYDRLPFVVSIARVQGRLQLFSIGEWQPTALSDYPDYVLLYQYRDGAARSTDRQPRRPVALG